jgi:hypothetical protein
MMAPMAGVLALDIPLSALGELFEQMLGQPVPESGTGDEVLDLVDGLAGALSPIVVDAQLHFLRDSGIVAQVGEDPESGLERPESRDVVYSPFAPIGYRTAEGTVSLAVLIASTSGDTGVPVDEEGQPTDAEAAEMAARAVRTRLGIEAGELRALPITDR